jgi:acyl-CoA synthetase (NDP forming)
MLTAASVAVVGASSRPGSFGEMMMRQLVGGGYQGAVYPVNPGYDQVMGLKCLRSLDELPGPIDLVVLGVANERLEHLLEQAAALGTRSAAIFASGRGTAADGSTPLATRLAEIAHQAGMALCGVNGMGFLNLDHRLRICGYVEPEDAGPGPVCFLTHSGSLFTAFLHNRRSIRFNLAVSTGQELVTTMDEYLEYAVAQPTTKVVALFIETIRRPSAFAAALASAAAKDIPVVALKAGRSPRSRAMVAAHSGALAGEDLAYQAFFEANGVIQVETIPEMVDTVELMASPRRAGGGKLGVVHDSGGERAHLVDLADKLGVGLAEITEPTKIRLSEVLEPGLEAINPVDVWGSGIAAESVMVETLRALSVDPAVAALAFAVDFTSGDHPTYTSVAVQAASETSKPFAILPNLGSAIDPVAAGEARLAGVPVLEGAPSGLAAFSHLFEYARLRSREPMAAAGKVDGVVVDRWRDRLQVGGVLPEVEALRLLGDFGLPVVANRKASSLKEAGEAAAAIGYPVALKTAAPGIVHKTEVDGVILGVSDDHQLGLAYSELQTRLGPHVLVAAMAPPGVELALGVVNDPDFGPLIIVAAGGALVEVIGDRTASLPPVDHARAMELMDRLAVRKVLDGVRGRKPADLASVASAIASLSLLVTHVGDLIAAIDVNPLIATWSGAWVVDALVEVR